MNSMRVRLPRPLEITVKGKFLGIDVATLGRIIAIESYEGNVPTFTWISKTGHIFNFLPPHAFGPNETALVNHIDIECPAGPIDVSNLGFEEGGFGKIGINPIAWKRYIASIDWPESNELLHIVMTKDKDILLIRNARFQVGGSRYDPPSWKKAPTLWKLK